MTRPRLGINTHIAWQPPMQRPAYVALAAELGATTVRDTVEWSAVEPVRGTYRWAGVDEMVGLTAERGISLLPVVAYSPPWATSSPGTNKAGPTDPDDYAAFVAALVWRYRRDGAFWRAHSLLPYVPLAGVELWNEPNHGAFWRRPDARSYAGLLVLAYYAAKAAHPGITVVAGATATMKTDAGKSVHAVDFLEQMYAAGAGGHFDAVSHHPYRFWRGATAAQILTPHAGSGFTQLEQLRTVMAANGDSDKPIWLTEVGAPTHSAGVTEQTQADLASQLVHRLRAKPWAGPLYWYDLVDDGPLNVAEHRFGAVRRDGSRKPLHAALRAAFAEDTP